MNHYLKKILIVILTFVMVLFDISLFSFWDLHGATVISSLVFILFLAMAAKSKTFLIPSLSALFFFSVFSSLPMLVLFLNFIILPAAVHFFRIRFFPEPNIFSSFFYFVAGSFCFEFVLLIFSGEWNQAGFLTLGYFILINSLFGLLCFLSYIVSRRFFALPEIKV